MRISNQVRVRQQVKFLRELYQRDGSLPFGDVLSPEFLAQAIAALKGVWKDRITRRW